MNINKLSSLILVSVLLTSCEPWPEPPNHDHKWSLWGKPEQCHFPDTHITKQFRQCEVCGEAQERKVYPEL